MKLTFFEKNEIEKDKAGIAVTTNDPNVTNQTSIREEAGSLKSTKAQKRFRFITKALSVVDFFKDGARFSSKFKVVDLTRGEAATNSSFRSETVAKSISHTFRESLDFLKIDREQQLVPLNNLHLSPTVKQIPAETFDGVLSLSVGENSSTGTETVSQILEGKSFENQVITEAPTRSGSGAGRISRIEAFKKSLTQGNYFYSGDFAGNLTKTTAVNLLPPPTKEEVTELNDLSFPNQAFTGTNTGNLKLDISVSEISRSVSIREPSLFGGGGSRAISPIVQRYSYSVDYNLKVINQSRYRVTTSQFTFGALETERLGGDTGDAEFPYSYHIARDVSFSAGDLTDLISLNLLNLRLINLLSNPYPLETTKSGGFDTRGEGRARNAFISSQNNEIREAIDAANAEIFGRIIASDGTVSELEFDAIISPVSVGIIDKITQAYPYLSSIESDFEGNKLKINNTEIKTFTGSTVSLESAKSSSTGSGNQGLSRTDLTLNTSPIVGNSRIPSSFSRNFFISHQSQMLNFIREEGLTSSLNFRSNFSSEFFPVELRTRKNTTVDILSADATKVKMLEGARTFESAEPTFSELSKIELRYRALDVEAPENFEQEYRVARSEIFVLTEYRDTALFETLFEHLIGTRTVAGIASVPTFSEWITNNYLEITRAAYILDFVISAGSLIEGVTEPPLKFSRKRRESLISSPSRDFPFVSVLDLFHENNKLSLVLGRQSQNAPLPSKTFFDSFTVGGLSFNFSESQYQRFTDVDSDSNKYGVKVSRYSWDSEIAPASRNNLLDVIFRKAGTSAGGVLSEQRQVTKSTINSKMALEKPEILGGFRVENIEFNNNLFKITFDEGGMSANSFSFLEIFSKDRSDAITRQLLTSDAVITEGNIFSWTGFSEFEELKKNKDYQIDLVKGANNKELRFFVPNPSGDFHFLKNVKSTDDKFLFSLLDNGTRSLTSNAFNSFKLTRNNNQNIISSQIISLVDQKQVSDKERDYSFSSSVPATLLKGKYKLRFEVEDLPHFQIDFLKLTDFCFDTIIITDTNLDDLSITDVMSKNLIHPSDILEFKEVVEDGKRNVVMFLKNSITGMNIKFNNTRVSDGLGIRKIGQMFLFSKIGSFSQFPFVKVFASSDKTNFKSQFNKSHIKTLPESLNYNFNFPPLDKEKDLILAQDLFARTSNYNEFVVWVSGGDLSKLKLKGLKGFRFKDLIRSLTINDFSFNYEDGRFSSGVKFEMDTVEV